MGSQWDLKADVCHFSRSEPSALDTQVKVQGKRRRLLFPREEYEYRLFTVCWKFCMLVRDVEDPDNQSQIGVLFYESMEMKVVKNNLSFWKAVFITRLLCLQEGAVASPPCHWRRERDGLVESTLAVWWMHKCALCAGLCVWEDLWWNVCFFPASYLPCRRFLEICTYCGVMIGSRVHLFRFSAWEPNFYSVNSKSLDLKI